MVQGLSHITFVVRDLDKMEEMLTQVLDANKIYDSGDKTFSLSRERFFDIAGTWVAIMEGEPLPTKTYKRRLRNGLRFVIFLNLVIRLCRLSFQRTQSV